MTRFRHRAVRPILLAAVLLISNRAVGVAVSPASAPNIVVITADDLRPWLGCYGHPAAQTPHLDRLAREGMRFERAFVQQAWCSPSRTSLLTGLRPDTTRVYDLETPFRTTTPAAVTLPQYFKAHGYTSAAFGKVWHETMDDAASWSVATWRPEHPDPLRAYMQRDNNDYAAAHKGYAAPVEAGDGADESYPDGQVASAAIEFLRQRAGRPFFLCVGFYKPHLPFAAPKRYSELYRREALASPQTPGPTGAPEQAFLQWAEHHNYRGVPRKPGSEPLPDALAAEFVHGYLACVSFVDAQVGRILAALEELRLAENTVVVFWGDHGWKLGDHGHWSKNSIYDADTRVPLLVRGPGVRRGSGTAALVEMLDVYPTLAELARLPAPAGVDGRSFAAVLRGDAERHKEAVFSQVIRNDARAYTTYAKATWMAQSMRTERHRVVRWFHRQAPETPVAVELYDFATHAVETENVAGRPEHAAALNAALRRMDVLFRPSFP